MHFMLINANLIQKLKKKKKKIDNQIGNVESSCPEMLSNAFPPFQKKDAKRKRISQS